MSKKKKEKDLEKKEQQEKDLEDIENLLDGIVNGEKSEESLEEFISGLNKQIKKKNNNNSIAYIFGLLVHKNIFIHFLITLVLNYALMFSLQGFFKLIDYDKFYIFVLAILLFTIVECIIKFLFIRFFLKIVLSTFGLFFLILQILYFELLYYFLPGFGFENQINLVVFVFLFALCRYVITRVAHRYIATLKKE